MSQDFRVGDQVKRVATGEVGVVRRPDPNGNVEVVLAAGGKRILHADELELLLDDPVEALLAGTLADSVPYGLRLQSLYLRHAYRYDPLAGLSNARMEPALHQIFVAHRVVSKLRPRMILADEVGLGKTIEAGLILKELRARELIDRVLIVVPASLQHQWQQELSSKFNEDFQIVDGPAVRFLGRAGDNPWAKQESVICSTTLAAQPRNAEQIVEAGWDLVIFDEAHRVRRRLEGAGSVRSTRAYDLADELKELTYGLLLLSATPMQLHPFELYSLVELVEPGLYPSFDDYEMRRRELPRLNELMKGLLGWAALTEAEREHLRSLAARLKVSHSTPQLDDLAQRTVVMDRLVEMHPLADALVRNRKSEVGGFTQRVANVVPVELTHEEQVIYEDVSEYIRRGYDRAQTEKRYAVGFLMVLYQQMLASSSSAIRRSFQRRIDKLRTERERMRGERMGAGLPTDEALQEMRDAEEATLSLEELEQIAIDEAGIDAEILELEALVARLGKLRDSKARELVKAIKMISRTNSSEKVLVFTRYIETQSFLRQTLEANGFPTAVFNGSMNLEDKEAAVREFKGPAQILVTTEAGGEGRNFQFAHFMFNYDLPWNPMRVEQRIGRLDRIGQKKPVFIYNLACVGTVEERILEVLDKRIGLFEESVGSLDAILGEIERDIERLVLSQSDSFDEAFEEFAEAVERQVRGAREAERLFSDFILDQSSFRRDRANELLSRPAMAGAPQLQDHVTRALAYHGGRLTDHPDGGLVVNLSPRLAGRLKSREAAIRGVFDPREALEREDLPFLAFGHPLVDTLVDLSLSDVKSICGGRCLPGLSGGPYVELFYEVESTSLDRMGLFIHHLVDESGVVTETELRTIPEIGKDAPGVEVPEWADAAIRNSLSHLDERVGRERASVRERHRFRQGAEVERALRVHEYRIVRLGRIIEDEERWIAEKELHGTDRERRILPARRGKLRRNRDRLEGLGEEHRLRVEEIHAKTADVAVKVLAAGVVMGS